MLTYTNECHFNIWIKISMIRPMLEHATVVWSQSLKKDIRFEWIQKIATKMVPQLNDLTYEKRLKYMRLPTLQDRREQGDLI
ncbi:hypothetical protein E2C01_051251 [Portunus trituberculatus]|uniref:Uncharacterized protein n=1 Tax=Portunus trituberculatus TaxID=210409 RepID=A0A5B7GIK4_PORTR|nr:hypothetical protein [Portunus trituberculatus]